MDNSEAIFCQTQLLPGVSRTFALTIPQLPSQLRTLVTNAYLLCRIADTIEDDLALSAEEKASFHQQFRAVLTAETCDKSFSEKLLSQLSHATTPAECRLIQYVPTVIRNFRSFTPKQQTSLQRCINIMSTGMPEFQRTASLAGLPNMANMDRYCYYVAGVVGEMLTELFCDYSSHIEKHRSILMPLAASFGQALQMTNILKDFWDDRQRQVCWLPADIFAAAGLNLTTWAPGQKQNEFNQAYQQLVLIALNHLKNALQYILLIPSNEIGIRRFTFWAVGMAALTLQNIYSRPYFKNSDEIKISRNSVKAIILASNACCRSNRLLNHLFTFLTRKLK